MNLRHTALLLASVSLAASACKDKPADTNATPSATTAAASESAAPAAKPFQDPGEDSSLASADVLPTTGTPPSVKTLVMFDLPQPKNVAASAIWSSV
ncbi:hypothetical protein BH09MYX1_BH09MYX1_66890 [soil metagenome]